MLDILISSKTRVKLLLRFFLNPQSSAYLRGLSTEFGESSNAIRVELNRLEEAGLLQSALTGNKKYFRANQKHPLFQEIRNIVIKHVGVDKLVEHVISNLGNVQKVYLTGDLAAGKNSSIIDVIIIGEVDKTYLAKLVDRAENLLGRKIRYLVFHTEETEENAFQSPDYLLIWNG